MIKGIGFSHEKFNFPCGEMQVKLGTVHMDMPHITWEFESNEEIFELLLIVDALKRNLKQLGNLYLPYVPFARQDRVNLAGEALSCSVFCSLINSCGFQSVCIADPHSDVVRALIDRVVVTEQHEIFGQYLDSYQKFEEPYILVCPDGGAIKKIHKFKGNHSIIYCNKYRDPYDGKIHLDIPELSSMKGKIYEGHNLIIIDDICDGGRTFLTIAGLLRDHLDKGHKIILMVTHGFFTKGLQVFDGFIDEIYTQKGKVR